MRWALAAVPGLLVACTGEPAPPTLMQRSPGPTGAPIDQPLDLGRTGDVGDLFLYTTLPTLEEPEYIGLAGLFGNELGPVAYPAACALTGALCVVPGAAEVASMTGGVEPRRSTWLGDRLQVGDFVLPFEVVQEVPLGGYTLSMEAVASLPVSLDLVVEDGEWSSGTLPSVVPRPPSIVNVTPSPYEPVVVGSKSFQSFTWEPTGIGDVWLVTRGSGTETTRRLVDDGEVLVDLREVRWSGPLFVDLWRVRSNERDWNGNEVVAHGATQQSWCVIERCDGPPVEAYPARMPFTFSWTAANDGAAEWTLFEDGTWRAGSSRGTWSYDCCSQVLAMEFTTGTVYSGMVGPDGCIDGEMRSRTGGTGTWSGCL